LPETPTKFNGLTAEPFTSSVPPLSVLTRHVANRTMDEPRTRLDIDLPSTIAAALAIPWRSTAARHPAYRSRSRSTADSSNWDVC
jgi:hypothetical protein